MRRRKLLYGLGASGAVLVPSGLTAAAYNSFTLTREASIGVEGDGSASAFLTLSPGTSNIVSTNTNDELDIAIGNAIDSNKAAGVNVGSQLDVGTFSDPTSTPAFTFQHNATDNQDIDISYNLTGTDGGDADANVQFKISDGSNEYTVTETGTLSLTGIANSTLFSVALRVDTNGLSSTEDLTGDLTITLNPSS
ncbi:hypothetical protein N0B31_07235 [Salinirubellus salinus]|uniref:Uncharacterized protein n=1 Tax=Salinirubellus salinus TaxID=1364945 RepID=A0A9E7R5R8_9EURY|nr:hypothetical protein [Salinirubellus salinus]UWM56077.1 hypothetical protein N0B31_07235 [Salinirubellus salinus]